MIHLFRRIRSTLIKQEQVGKYLLYAIGEIFLVVIGIIIALSINNWNEQRVSRLTETYYLKSLQKSIEQDTFELNNTIKDINLTLFRIDSISNSSQNSQDQESLSGILPNLYMSTFNLKVETSTFDDLKSSGNLNLIRNKSLRELLSVYYKDLDSQENGINRSLLTYSRETMGPYLMKRYRIVFNDDMISSELDKQYGLSLDKFNEDLFLVNALGFRKAILTELKLAYMGAFSNAKEILDIIENEELIKKENKKGSI